MITSRPESQLGPRIFWLDLIDAHLPSIGELSSFPEEFQGGSIFMDNNYAIFTCLAMHQDLLVLSIPNQMERTFEP